MSVQPATAAAVLRLARSLVAASQPTTLGHVYPGIGTDVLACLENAAGGENALMAEALECLDQVLFDSARLSFLVWVDGGRYDETTHEFTYRYDRKRVDVLAIMGKAIQRSEAGVDGGLHADAKAARDMLPPDVLPKPYDASKLSQVRLSSGDVLRLIAETDARQKRR